VSRRFERYVAIGDSTTEGLDDPDGRGGYRGWANRLAERLAEQQGGLLYANLAVRGRGARQIREEQLERALAMRPDLVTAVAGMNDLVRPRFDVEAVAREVEAMQRALVSAGATVLTFSLPDLSRVLPLARHLAPRVQDWSGALRRVCARTGAICVDFAATPVASDPRLWSEDRFHANAAGHALISRALADALGLAGADASWAEPLPDAGALPGRAGLGSELRWWRRHFAPWLWRRVRGRSSGDGRGPKRPELSPFPDPSPPSGAQRP
jgi:lysophospholipase L1-like esterase